jgi:hypothetical protein
MAVGPNAALRVQGYVNSFCMAAMMVMVVIILLAAARRCVRVVTGRLPVLVTEPASAD